VFTIDQLIKQIIVLFIFLAAASFFWFVAMPKNLLLLLAFGSTMFMVLTLILSMIYLHGRKFPQNFTFEVTAMLFSSLLAMFGARWGHNQDFLITFWAHNVMYFYFFYFFLHSIRIKPADLERMMIVIAYLYIIFFLLQYLAYPTLLFGTRVDESRGTIRIFLPGKAFVVLMFFYFLQKFFVTNNLKYMGFCLATFIVTILQGTRNAIFLLLLGTVVNLLFSKRVKSRLAITFILFLALTPAYFIFQDIFLNLFEVSENQAAAEGEDVRVRAAKFFLSDDFNKTRLNYIFGNGMSHMASQYGLEEFLYKADLGFFISDIGIVGEYVRYGVLYILGVILIIRKIFVLKYDPQYYYVKYYTFVSFLGMLIGGVFTRPDSYLVFLAMMYIIDISIYDKKNLEKSSVFPETQT
jgi:hypothetical protein